MSVQNDILGILNERGQPVKSSELAEKLKKPGSTIRGETTRLKQKGHVEGDSQEGWLITDAGRKALEQGEGPSMIEEGVTPRQKFEAIAQRIGIKEERIALAADIVWSGDYNDLSWVWEALGQADIRDDLRKIWVNSWRAFLHKGIPPELEVELTGAGKAETAEGKETTSPSKRGREYIIVNDEPVRVGENLGDYSLQDAKDILGIRALRSRFSGSGQAGAQGGAGSQAGPPEKVSELLTALEPYVNKGSDQNMLRELLITQMALQKQEILSQIPQPVQHTQPRSFIEQITEFVAAIGSLKEAGPMIRSILGVPESSSPSQNPGLPVQLAGPDGKPMIMDLGQIIDWKRFLGEERRADERQATLSGLAQTARENAPDGIRAILAAAQESKEERKTGTGAKTPASSQQQQSFNCGDCGTKFSLSTEILNNPQFESATCEKCGRKYTKEELLG